MPEGPKNREMYPMRYAHRWIALVERIKKPAEHFLRESKPVKSYGQSKVSTIGEPLDCGPFFLRPSFQPRPNVLPAFWPSLGSIVGETRTRSEGEQKRPKSQKRHISGHEGTSKAADAQVLGGVSCPSRGRRVVKKLR